MEVPSPDVPEASARAAAALTSLIEAELAYRQDLSSRWCLSDNDQRALLLIADMASGGTPARAGDIGSALGISTASVTVLVNRLESAGLARRGERFSDRRSLAIEPTPVGINTARALRTFPEPVHALLRELSAGDARVLTDVATRWADALTDRPNRQNAPPM